MNNPLYIKLALNSVADGLSFEKAFEPQKDLLNFSYKTIYEKLSDISRKLVKFCL